MAYDFSVDFSPIATLPKVYKDAQNERSLAELGKGLADGSLDYRQAAGRAAEAGRLDLGLSLLKLGREQEATDAFTKQIGSIYQPQAQDGFQPQSQPQPQQMQMPAPGSDVAPPRAPVPSTPKVWGDKEAEAAGLYEPRAQGAQPAQQQQPPQQQVQLAPPRQTGPAMPATASNPATRSIPMLLGAVSNPGLPQPQRDAAKALLEHALKTSDLPPDQKNYVLYRTQGGSDDFTTWDRGNKTAGATMINTAPGMEAKQTEARIDIDKNAIKDLAQKTVAGRSALPLINQMITLADKTPGGWAGAASPYIAKGMATLGIEVPEGISNAELLAAASRQLIPSIRDPGSTSNYEQSLYMQAIPSLSQSPEGRIKIANMLKAQIQRNSEIMQVYRQNVGSPDLDKKLSALDAKPMFSFDERKLLETATGGAAQQPAAQQGGPTRINSPAERAALPPGTRYIAPDGSERIKQ
jgi:hypothetical protein